MPCPCRGSSGTVYGEMKQKQKMFSQLTLNNSERIKLLF